MTRHLWLGCLLGLVLQGSAWTVRAQGAAIDREAEMRAANAAANASAIQGPASVPLKDQATLTLPAGYVFIPQPAADQLLAAMGNGKDPSRIGLVFPAGSEAFVVARYIDSGYVKDEEAKDWNAEEMLKQLKAGTEEGNKERVARGIPEMDIVGWVQKPTYAAETHQLVWSIESRDKPAGSANDTASANGINYNTFVLGREGYLSLNLVTDMQAIGEDKQIAGTLLSATTFNDGKRYADFNVSTDRVAEYGIAALVAGAAAKKLGFFALIAAFLAKFSKVLILAAAPAFMLIKKLFTRKQNDAPQA